MKIKFVVVGKFIRNYGHCGFLCALWRHNIIPDIEQRVVPCQLTNVILSTFYNLLILRKCLARHASRNPPHEPKNIRVGG